MITTVFGAQQKQIDIYTCITLLNSPKNLCKASIVLISQMRKLRLKGSIVCLRRNEVEESNRGLCTKTSW